jgi:ribosomal-protein-alanine N-acetyltransferase
MGALDDPGVEVLVDEGPHLGAEGLRLGLEAEVHPRPGRLALFIFRHDDDALIGGVTLSNIRRGVAQMASLGYWAGQALAGRGYTTAAVRAVVRYAFEDLDLHRVEAACQPDNLASRRVLEKAGFTHEGQAKAYLKINGRWRDHLLFGVVNETL